LAHQSFQALVVCKNGERVIQEVRPMFDYCGDGKRFSDISSSVEEFWEKLFAEKGNGIIVS